MNLLGFKTLLTVDQLGKATTSGSSEDLKDGGANHNKDEETQHHRTHWVAAGLLHSRFGYLPSLENVLLELGTFVIGQSLRRRHCRKRSIELDARSFIPDTSHKQIVSV